MAQSCCIINLVRGRHMYDAIYVAYAMHALPVGITGTYKGWQPLLLPLVSRPV